MELRLQQFIESVQKLSDVRNLDRRNPIIFEMEHPATATKYQVAGSILEPSDLGVPVHTTWIVLDPSSKYYMQALKLRDTTYDVNATDFEAAAGMHLLWTICRTYDDLWEGEQYYTANKGPKGDKGDPGENGVADYDTLIDLLKSRSGSLSISGVDHVGPNSKTAYRVLHTLGETTTEVFVPIVNSTPTDGVEIRGDNVLRVGAVGESQLKLHAYYSPAGVALHAELMVSVAAAQITGLVINGAGSVFEGKTISFTATATFDDGSTKTVVPTWSASTGTISTSGTLTAPSVNADELAVITAVVGGITATKQITVKNLVATGVSIVGAASVEEGKTAQYNLTVAYNDGSTASGVGVWSVVGSAASISAAGMLTANLVAANTNVTVNASASIEGVTLSATKTVTVSNVAAVLYPKFGAGPFTPYGVEFDAFIESLSGTGASPNSKAATYTLDLTGPNVFGWYACPASFGIPNFLDPASNLPYGMDGATNPGISIPATANLLVASFARPLNIAGTVQFSEHSADPTVSDTATNNHVWYNNVNGKLWKKLSSGWSEIGSASKMAALKEGDYFFDGKEAGIYKYTAGAWKLIQYAYEGTGALSVTIDGVAWNVYRTDRGNLGAGNQFIVS